MAGNVEQQLILERMQARYIMDKMNENANRQVPNHTLSIDGVISAPSRVYRDASTNTYDLLSSEDVDMKTVS